MKSIVEINEKEYADRKLEAAKTILPVMMSQLSMEYMQDTRKRASVIYNAVAIANEMLREIGFVPTGASANPEKNTDRTAIRKLSEMLGDDED